MSVKVKEKCRDILNHFFFSFLLFFFLLRAFLTFTTRTFNTDTSVLKFPDHSLRSGFLPEIDLFIPRSRLGVPLSVCLCSIVFLLPNRFRIYNGKLRASWSGAGNTELSRTRLDWQVYSSPRGS